jgi:antitoxin HicB
MTQADTFAELEWMIEDAMRTWIEVSIEAGDPIHEPGRLRSIDSGKFVTRVPRSLHRDLVQTVEKERVSLNAIMNAALVRAVGQPSLVLLKENDANAYSPKSL